MEISISTQRNMEEYILKRYKGILSKQQFIRHHNYILDEDFNKILFLLLNKVCLLNKNTRLLDIGCGLGSFVLYCRKQGLFSYGISPDKIAINVAQRRLEENINAEDTVFTVAKGEQLPYLSESFNVVTMFHVLEHIKNWKIAFSEAYRVLKKGGFLYIITTNYLATFTESHYHLFWLPMLNKTIASFYLSLLGRDPKFLQKNIFYLTHFSLFKELKNKKMKLFFPKLIKIEHPEFIKNNFLRFLVLSLKKCNLAFLVHMFCNSPFQPVINVIAQKNINYGSKYKNPF